MNQYCQQAGRGLAFPISGQSIDLPVSTPTVCSCAGASSLGKGAARTAAVWTLAGGTREASGGAAAKGDAPSFRRGGEKEAVHGGGKGQGLQPNFISLGYALIGQIWSIFLISVNSFIFGFVLCKIIIKLCFFYYA